MSYVYIRSETAAETGDYPLYTVGFYKPDGTFEPDGDFGGFNGRADAASRVAYLNGSHQTVELMDAIACGEEASPEPDPALRHCDHAGETPWVECDARGIPLTKVCGKCRAVKLAGFRPEVLTDPNYCHDEPLEEPL